MTNFATHDTPDNLMVCELGDAPNPLADPDLARQWLKDQGVGGRSPRELTVTWPEDDGPAVLSGDVAIREIPYPQITAERVAGRPGTVVLSFEGQTKTKRLLVKAKDVPLLIAQIQRAAGLA